MVAAHDEVTRCHCIVRFKRVCFMFSEFWCCKSDFISILKNTLKKGWHPKKWGHWVIAQVETWTSGDLEVLSLLAPWWATSIGLSGPQLPCLLDNIVTEKTLRDALTRQALAEGLLCAGTGNLRVSYRPACRNLWIQQELHNHLAAPDVSGGRGGRDSFQL